MIIWPPAAKIVHALGGYALALTIMTVSVHQLRLPWAPLIAILVVAAVAVAKEIHDGSSETMTTHWHDVLITTGGAVLAVAVHLVLR